MTSGLLNISISGLNAAQAGLLTTGHNITNASTPGYNRQSIVQTSAVPVYAGSGYIGTGVNVDNVKRNYNDVLNGLVLSAQTMASQLQTYSTQINRIDNLLADNSAGLAPIMQSYFSAVSAAASNPSSLAARQSVISTAQSLTSRFQMLDGQFSEMRNSVNSQIRTSVTDINSLASQIGALNKQISESAGVASQQMPNDLLDQRDQLIADLNKQVRVTTHTETDGSLSVFIGSGQPLVVGTQAYQLTTVPGQEDATELTIGLTIPGAGTTSIPESLLDGGSLGGLLNYRSKTLDAAQNSLGRIALAFATTMNTQHRLGQDLNGNLGGNLFNPLSLGTMAAPANTGTGSLTATVTVSDYRVTVAAGAYQITRLSDNTNLGSFATLPQVVDGTQISLSSGTPANGDVFLVSPSAAAGSRVTALTTNTGTGTLDSSGSNLQTLTDSDYRLQLTAANTFTLTRLSDSQVWVGTGASQAAAFADLQQQAGAQGFSATLTGTMAVNDSFLIRPTRTAARDISLAISDPRLLALGTPMRTAAATANTGNATISAGSVTNTSSLPTSNVSLSYGAGGLQGFPTGATVLVTPPGGQPTSYTIPGPATVVPYTSGATIAFNGMSFAITGQPASGDTFTVGPNPAGISDGRNAIALGNLQTTSTMMDGSANYQGAYASLVADVGNKAREVNVRLDAQNKLVQEGKDAVQSQSGVNLDEEAANLMRYQQAYQASAKIIEIADKLFTQLLTLGG